MGMLCGSTLSLLALASGTLSSLGTQLATDVRRILIFSSAASDRPYPSSDSRLIESLYRVAAKDPGCSILPQVAIDAMSKTLPPENAHPERHMFRLAERLKVEGILQPKLHQLDRRGRTELHIEVGLRSPTFGGFVANGFSKVSSKLSTYLAGERLTDREIDTAMAEALRDLWRNTIPMATVRNAHDDIAILSPVDHPRLVAGLPAFSVRGRHAVSLFVVDTVAKEAVTVRVIRMHGPMSGDRMLFLNVRPGPDQPPILSEYYRPPFHEAP